MKKFGSYTDEFFSLNCSKDVMLCYDAIKNFEKELSEAMSIKSCVRKFGNINDYMVLDLCSGNALSALVTHFTLKPYQTIAVDINVRPLHLEHVNGFAYIQHDIRDVKGLLGKLNDFDGANNIIVTATHPCRDLANQVINVFKSLKAKQKHLVMMPCCKGGFSGPRIPQVISDLLGRYLTWSYYLCQKVNGNMTVDNRCISPCNALIYV